MANPINALGRVASIMVGRRPVKFNKVKDAEQLVGRWVAKKPESTGVAINTIKVTPTLLVGTTIINFDVTGPGWDPRQVETHGKFVNERQPGGKIEVKAEWGGIGPNGDRNKIKASISADGNTLKIAVDGDKIREYRRVPVQIPDPEPAS